MIKTVLIWVLGISPLFADPSVLIPEIQCLSKCDEITDNIFHQYPINTIAENLVYWHQNHHLGGRTDLTENTELQIWFPEGKVPAILKSGFRNIYQTKERSDTTRSRRAAIEYNMIGIPIESAKRVSTMKLRVNRLPLFPKYSILDVHTEKNIGNFEVSGDTYGQIAAVLKGSVKRRTTWTPNDSYDTGTYEVESLKKGFFIPGESSYYFEGQIWGDLSLSDVEYFMVSHNVSTLTLKRLKKTNLPIYKWKNIPNFHGRTRSMRGEPVFHPGGCTDSLK